MANFCPNVLHASGAQVVSRAESPFGKGCGHLRLSVGSVTPFQPSVSKKIKSSSSGVFSLTVIRGIVILRIRLPSARPESS